MKVKLILCLLVILVLFSACAKNQITASSIENLPIEKQIEIEAKVTSAEACRNIECGSNSRCIDGKCVCNDGYKECNGECILLDQCCTENDCSEDESCREHHCVTDNCGVNEVFDIQKNRCDCDDDSKYCSAQHKCIPKTNCCLSTECSTGQRCVETNYLAVICIDGDKTQCRSVYEDRGESFFIGGVEYEVDVNKFLQDNGIDLTVNDQKVLIRGNEVLSVGDNVNIYVDNLELVGGHCKRDD